MRELSFYRKQAKIGGTTRVMFTRIDKEKQSYVAYEEGIRIELPIKEYLGVDVDIENWSDDRILRVLGHETEVLVDSVKKLSKTVICKKVNKKKVSLKSKEEINEAISRGECITVRGRVSDIIGEGSESFAIITAENAVKCVLPCRRWSYDYIEDLRDVTRVGDTVDVVVYAESDARGDYLASRLELLNDPWIGLSNKINKGDMVVCEIFKEMRKGGFCAGVLGFDGITAYVLPSKRENFHLHVGRKYICNVSSLKEKEHVLRVYPCFTWKRY